LLAKPVMARADGRVALAVLAFGLLLARSAGPVVRRAKRAWHTR
jgi:mxaL protein